VGPPHPDQTNKRTDPDRSPADPSCAAPADDPIEPTESRIASRLNESFATESGVEQTSSGSGGTSVFDPHVWSGRALQVDFAELAVSGLASMYPVSSWSVVLLAIMDISARAVSLADRPRLGHLGHQCSHAPGRPNLHLYLSSRRPRQVRVIDLAMSSRIPHLTFSYSTIKQVGRWRSTSPRSPDHGPGRTKRCGPACWPARSRARCGAAASWRPRSRI
jgi:hypothetical protein